MTGDDIDLQAELIASEARFYNAVDISPDGVVVIDTSGMICFINDAAQSLFSRQKETLLGREFGFPLVSGKKTEIEIIKSNAKPLIAEMRVVKIVWEKQLAFLASLRDITKHTQLLDELSKANSELLHFSYAVSHDIKAPLRNMHSLASFLIEDYSTVLDTRVTADIKTIEDSSSRMLRLVDGLLHLTQIGASESSSILLDLNDVFVEALDNIKSDIVESGAEISIEKLPCIHANGVQLVSLFQNLLCNSIKYCDNQTPKISVNAKRIKNQWEISITDNGIGIEKQYWEKIFLPFERLHTIAEYDGSGVGLASCKKIVDVHNGRIRVESEPGIGSTFFISLPVSS